MSKAEQIKKSVTALDVCQRYGVPVNRSGFTSCLWHHEKTPSMKVYGGTGGVHCYGCGKNGSVIDLTMQIHGIDFLDACMKLDEDFGLHLYDELDRPHHPRKKNKGELLEEARKEYEERKKKKHEQERLESLETAYNEAERKVIKLSRLIREFDPRGKYEGITSEYADAIRKLPIAMYEADEAERELYEALGIGKKND